MKNNAGVFTPRTPSGERLSLTISASDAQSWGAIARQRTGRSVVVTDQKSGKRYRIRAASCGLRKCYCDALAVEEYIQ